MRQPLDWLAFCSQVDPRVDIEQRRSTSPAIQAPVHRDIAMLDLYLSQDRHGPSVRSDLRERRIRCDSMLASSRVHGLYERRVSEAGGHETRRMCSRLSVPEQDRKTVYRERGEDVSDVPARLSSLRLSDSVHMCV